MNVVSQFENGKFPRHRPHQCSLRSKMDPCQAIFFRLKSIISSRSPHIKLAMMWTVIRSKRREKNHVVCLICSFRLHIHTYTILVRAKRGENFVRLTWFVVFQSILSIHTNYTHLVRAKRGENMKLYYVYYTILYYFFILCTHITTPLLFRAERRDKMYCITYYIQCISTCSVL